jgi:hypothetical protein
MTASISLFRVLLNIYEIGVTTLETTENTTNMPSKGNSPFKPMKDIKISEKGVEKELKVCF